MKVSLASRTIRFALVVAVAWLIAATLLYVGAIGIHVDMSWTPLWYMLFPLATHIPPFDASCPLALSICTFEFSPIGFASFVIYPIFVFWAVLLAISWVRKGSANSASTK